MTSFPRTDSKGYVDDGRRIGTTGETCWNCGSSRYYQTVSVEHCPACGIRCDYWSPDGTNEAYLRAMRRKDDAEEREEEQRRWAYSQNWQQEDQWP